MKPLGFVYEHNEDGRLIHLHTEDWVPGMYNKEGKFFKLESDPRKLKIPEKKISLAAPQKPKGAVIKSKKISTTPTKSQKAKGIRRCKKGRKFSDEEVFGAISKKCRRSMKIGTKGESQWWISRPKIAKQLRGFCMFDKGAEFSQFYMEEGSGKLYVWTKPGVTINSPIETADFVIHFNLKCDQPKGKK